MIDPKWSGEHGSPDPLRAATMLMAILVMSNDAERERDPFGRRMRLNEMQESIQAARIEIEGFAEGIMFRSGDGEENGTGA